jgi:hypothetical protein
VSGGTTWSRYLGFALRAAAVAAAVGAIGLWIAGGRGGPDAGAAAAAGCGIALAASLVGGLVIARRPADPRTAAVSALGATGLRLAAVAALVVLVALSGWVPLKPLLLWTAIGYVALLAVDTRYALAEAKAGEAGRDGAGPRP